MPVLTVVWLEASHFTVSISSFENRDYSNIFLIGLSQRLNEIIHIKSTKQALHKGKLLFLLPSWQWVLNHLGQMSERAEYKVRPKGYSMNPRSNVMTHFLFCLRKMRKGGERGGKWGRAQEGPGGCCVGVRWHEKSPVADGWCAGAKDQI